MPTVEMTDSVLIAETAYVIHHEQYRSFSRDQLLCHPDDAEILCEMVRSQLHRPKLTDFEILWTYLNAHKRGLMQDGGKIKPRRPPPAARRIESRRPSRRKS